MKDLRRWQRRSEVSKNKERETKELREENARLKKEYNQLRTNYEDKEFRDSVRETAPNRN